MTSNNAKMATALVGGYLLGRTKKAKMAIGFGMFLAGKKLSLDPAQLGKALTNSKLLDGLNDQVRGELFDATKTAASTALTQRIGGIADSLHERSLRLEGGGAHSDDAESGDRDSDRDRDRDSGRKRKPRGERHEDDANDEPEREPPARPKAKSAPSKTASSSRSRASGTAKKTASDGRKATSAARKTRSSARKTASGATRRAGAKGGGNG